MTLRNVSPRVELEGMISDIGDLCDALEIILLRLRDIGLDEPVPSSLRSALDGVGRALQNNSEECHQRFESIIREMHYAA